MKVVRVPAEWSWKALLVEEFPSIDSFSNPLTIWRKFSLNIVMLLYFFDHRVSQKAGILGTFFLRVIKSRKKLMTSFIVAVVLQISGTSFESFTTKFNLWLAQWKYKALKNYTLKIAWHRYLFLTWSNNRPSLVPWICPGLVLFQKWIFLFPLRLFWHQ